MRTRYDHIDLRVRSLAEARPFYEALLPALGFTRDVRIEHWLQFEAAGVDSATEFFGVTESSRHVANECGSPSGQTVPARSTGWLRSSSGRVLGMSKGLGIMKGRATTPSFSRIPVAIGWKSAIEPKEPDERNWFRTRGS